MVGKLVYFARRTLSPELLPQEKNGEKNINTDFQNQNLHIIKDKSSVSQSIKLAG